MMRHAFALASMLLIGFATFEGRAASIDYDADLVGVWKLQTFSLQILGEQSKEVFGRDPIGHFQSGTVNYRFSVPTMSF